MKKIMSVIVLGMMLAVFSLNSQVQAKHNGKDHCEMTHCPYADLNLTSEQVKQVQKLHKDLDAKMKKNHQQMDKIIVTLNKKLQKGESEDVLRNEHQKLADLKAAMMQLKLDEVLAVKGILSPEQLKNYQGFRSWGMKGNSCPKGDKCEMKKSCEVRKKTCGQKPQGKMCDSKKSKAKVCDTKQKSDCCKM